MIFPKFTKIYTKSGFSVPFHAYFDKLCEYRYPFRLTSFLCFVCKLYLEVTPSRLIHDLQGLSQAFKKEERELEVV